MELEHLSPSRPALEKEKAAIASFLTVHLERFGDPEEQVRRALDYALDPARGGFVLTAREGGAIAGAVVVNDTKMGGYIPANILVYIAVDAGQRGKGIGRRLMEAAIANCTGGIALHVEPDNPARQLYESLGFTNKYLEMRLAQ
ncbi:MAG: GNAT family N-acetyltransferase [Flavobacteriales bacterium]|nr:GNAT family N-acetyltransferase [Flavobacteriales bacterium]MCL4281733.1 GNAT family N-acetyltransferase [Flavobacteriales bacterium]